MPSKKPIPPRTCNVSGCGRRAHGRGYQCSFHQNMTTYYGAPNMRAIPLRDLRRYEERVETALIRYENSKPVQAALEIARGILNYRPTGLQVRWQRELEGRMAYLRECGVQPMQLLSRVCCFYAYLEDHPKNLPTRRTELQALARAVFRLAPCGRWRPGYHIGQGLGRVVAESLGGFALGLIRRVDQDAATRRNLIHTASSIIFEEPNA